MQDNNTSPGKTSWTALAGFADPDQLDLAIGSLADKGLGADRICLLASTSGLDRLRGNAAIQARDTLRAGLDTYYVVGKLAAGSDLIAVPCDSSINRIEIEQERSRLGLLDGLDERMAAGTVVLLVHAQTPQELVDVTAVLLNHSSMRVRTRERPSQ